MNRQRNRGEVEFHQAGERGRLHDAEDAYPHA